MDLTIPLGEYGMEPKEARTYLAILEVGPASISDIAKKSGIKRPTTYNHIESLIRKQFVYKTTKGKRMLYVAQKPERLLSLLEEKRKAVEQLLPYLESLYTSTPRQPKIRLYEGREGVKAAYEEIFSTPYTIYSLFSPEKYFQVFTKEENSRLFSLLKKAGGEINDLLEQSRAAQEYVKHEYRSTISHKKFLPDHVHFSTDILVTGDTVALVSLKNITATIVDDKEIAETLRELLRFTWRSLKNIS